MAGSSSGGGGVRATRDQASPSPPFEPPTYSITMGGDKTLQWHPPVDSQELAWALSYHFPRPSSLEGKMRAAMADFMKQPRKSSPPGPAPNELSPSPPWSAGAERTLRHVRGEVSSARVLSGDELRAAAKSQAQSQAQSLAQARPSFAAPAQAQAPPAHDKPKAAAQRPAKFSSFFPGMSTFRLESGERHPVKPRKRPYSEQEKAQVARNRGNVCSFHKKRKQKCDPKNCQNRHRSPSSSPRSLRDGYFHPPNFQTQAPQPTDLPPRLTGDVPEQPEQSDWQAPHFQLENCQPWVTQLSLSSSQSSYVLTNTSLSEADSRPSQSFTTVSELPGAADERHKAVPTVSDPSNSPWDPVQTFLDSNDDPYMDGLELEEPNFEDPLPFDQYINIHNNFENFEYLDALQESGLEHVGRPAADSGIVDDNLGDLRNPAKSMDGLKELHCGSLKIFLDTVTPVPDEDTTPEHSVPTTAKLTPRAKESESLTRPPIPAGAELSPAGVKIMAQLQGGGHGQYDCDRGLVDPYPHPPVTTCRDRLVHDLSPNGLIRRCSTVSTASTRHSYGREMYDGGLILGAGGVVRRASAISSTSQSSRPTSNCGLSSSSRHYLDDIRRRGSHNSATSSSYRREDATGLRRGDSVGRNSLYGTAANSPHSPRCTDQSGSLDSDLEKTMDILVSKMSGTRIHV